LGVLFGRRLKSTGQRLGASGTLIHLQRHACTDDQHVNQFTMNVANVGDVEAVLCRHGEPLLLTKKFVTSADRDECRRVCAADGIITEVDDAYRACFVVRKTRRSSFDRDPGRYKSIFRILSSSTGPGTGRGTFPKL